MIDAFVLLTPLLLLGVMALLGFVGCDAVFGIPEVTPPPKPPTGVHAEPGNGIVTITWDSFPNALEFYVGRNETGGTLEADYPDQHLVLPADIPYVDDTVTNGTKYFYVVMVKTYRGRSAPSAPVDATPLVSGPFTTFVQMGGTHPGTLHNADGGWYGMAITVGAAPITVRALGRYFSAGNGLMHEIRIVDAASKAVLPGSSVMVNMALGSPNNYVYSDVTGTVVLAAGRSYYIVSVETVGGDFYCLLDSTVDTTTVASVTSAVSGDGVNTYSTLGGPKNTYGPVDFLY